MKRKRAHARTHARRSPPEKSDALTYLHLLRLWEISLQKQPVESGQKTRPVQLVYSFQFDAVARDGGACGGCVAATAVAVIHGRSVQSLNAWTADPQSDVYHMFREHLGRGSSLCSAVTESLRRDPVPVCAAEVRR